jgi:hypothetical protein
LNADKLHKNIVLHISFAAFHSWLVFSDLLIVKVVE